MDDRITPTNGTLHVVRWIRNDGRDICHKYFRRQTDVANFTAKLDAAGNQFAVFTTHTDWTPA